MNSVDPIIEDDPSWWEQNRHAMGVSMISMSIHVILLVIMALIILPKAPRDNTEYIGVRTVVTENPKLETIDNLDVTPPKLNDGSFNDMASLKLPTNVVAEQPAPIEIDQAQDLVQWEVEAEQFIGQIHKLGDLAGRTEKARTLLANASGGSASTEAAVSSGLKWLQEHQQKDGSWSFDHRHEECGDSCTGVGNVPQAKVGATGLGLLCFVGAGHTHKVGKYKPVVERALRYLQAEFAKAETPGDLRQTSLGNSGMYTQGIVTIALCELYALSKDRKVRDMAQACIDYIVLTQHQENGGWRYAPFAAVGDTSVVGWQVMALTSAKASRMKVPKRSFDLVDRYLTSVQVENGAYYGYASAEKKASTTAIGLLCRMYQGWDADNEELQKGMSYLSTIGPSPKQLYYNYYATQVMHHWGGPQWKEWNLVMREQLLTTQAKEGHATGSWPPSIAQFSDRGGRHYSTCLAVLTLEVYYRHLPIYQRRQLRADF